MLKKSTRRLLLVLFLSIFIYCLNKQINSNLDFISNFLYMLQIWLVTVFSEMNSCSPIVLFLQPFRINSIISSSLLVMLYFSAKLLWTWNNLSKPVLMICFQLNHINSNVHMKQKAGNGLKSNPVTRRCIINITRKNSNMAQNNTPNLRFAEMFIFL